MRREDAAVATSDELFLGIDIGTASTKGSLVNGSGELLASAERQHRVSMPHPGWVEHDVDSTWWGESLSILRELSAIGGKRIRAVGASGIGPCVAIADGQGRPLRPAILYGVDTRAVGEIGELTKRFGEEEILARCGSRLTTQSTGPKIYWLARNEPDTYAKAKMVFMASSYLTWRLTGSYVLDHHSASQSTPLYDRNTQSWAEDWAGEVASGLRLPRLVWPSEVVGSLTEEAAAETGLEMGTAVVAGTIDAWAESVSVGASAPGSTMLMYGSTMFIVAAESRPLSHHNLWGAVGVWPGTWSLAGGMATSGSLTGWFRDLLGDADFGELLEAAKGVPAGSRGLLVLPYFAGERTPLFDPDARGVMAGLTLRHGRAEIYRALLEATAMGVRHNLEVMSEAGADLSHLVAVGGGTKGSLWPEIVSSVCSRPQIIRRYSIGASYGDAFLSAVGVGAVGPEEQWNPAVDVIEPIAAQAEVYDPLYRNYLDLYRATSSQAHFLAELERSSG